MNAIYCYLIIIIYCITVIIANGLDCEQAVSCNDCSIINGCGWCQSTSKCWSKPNNPCKQDLKYKCFVPLKNLNRLVAYNQEEDAIDENPDGTPIDTDTNHILTSMSDKLRHIITKLHHGDDKSFATYEKLNKFAKLNTPLSPKRMQQIMTLKNLLKQRLLTLQLEKMKDIEAKLYKNTKHQYKTELPRIYLPYAHGVIQDHVTITDNIQGKQHQHTQTLRQKKITLYKEDNKPPNLKLKNALTHSATHIPYQEDPDNKLLNDASKFYQDMALNTRRGIIKRLHSKLRHHKSTNKIENVMKSMESKLKLDDSKIKQMLQ